MHGENEEAFKSHRAYETVRVKILRSDSTSEQKQKYNEKIRMRKYRERKKATGSNDTMEKKTSHGQGKLLKS